MMRSSLRWSVVCYAVRQVVQLQSGSWVASKIFRHVPMALTCKIALVMGPSTAFPMGPPTMVFT
jgi:hypothetical protein